MAFQLRRGTNAQRLTLTPLQGELIYTTDTKSLYVGDGTTAGGTVVGSGGGGATDLNDLTDVVINGGTLASGQVLKYDGTNWVNGTDSGGGSGATYEVSAETSLSGAILRLTGSDLTTDDITFAEGTNITITRTDANTITIDSAVAENDVLDYVGPWLEAGTNTGITFTYNTFTRSITTEVSQALGDISDVNLLTPANDGDVLKYDGISGTWGAATALLIDDPAPQLAGNLDLNGYLINGTGGITVEGDIYADGGIVVGGPTNYLGGITVISTSGNTVTDPMLTLVNYSSAGTVPLQNFLRGRGTPDIPLSSATGDVIGGMRFAGVGTNVTAVPSASASIFAVVDPNGVIGTNTTSGALVFQVRNNAGTMGNALTINQDGILKFPNASTVLPAVVDSSAAVGYLKVRVQVDPSTVADLYMPLFGAI